MIRLFRAFGLALVLAFLPFLCQAQESLGLQEAVELALAYHPTLGQARAQREVATEAFNQARSSRFPQLSADASLTRHQEPMLVAPLHGFDPAMAPTFQRDLVRGNLSLGYLLYDGGARGARIDGAAEGRGVAVAGEAVARMDIATEVTRAYLDVRSTQELLDATEAQKAALESEMDRVQQLLEVGKAARVDLLRVQAALSRTLASEISLESQIEVARGRLARLTGLDPSNLQGLALHAVTVRPPGLIPMENALDLAREASPELSLVRRKLAVAEAGVRQAKAKWYPTLQLHGAYTNFGALEEGHTQEWQGAVQLSYPLFSGGSRTAEVGRAEAERSVAREAVRSAELAVENAVEEAAASSIEAAALREALEMGLEQATEVARIEALALEVGSGVQTDFLRAQAELFQVRASLARARHQEVMASVRLARVAGQLDITWFQENTEELR